MKISVSINHVAIGIAIMLLGFKLEGADISWVTVFMPISIPAIFALIITVTTTLFSVLLFVLNRITKS